MGGDSSRLKVLEGRRKPPMVKAKIPSTPEGVIAAHAGPDANSDAFVEQLRDVFGG